MRGRRRSLLASTAIVLGLAGCGGDHGPSDGVAAAKCVSGIYDALSVPGSVRLDDQAVRVVHLDGNRKRVTGLVVVDRGGKVHGFTCVVSPDATDKLRELKIDSLTITPPTL